MRILRVFVFWSILTMIWGDLVAQQLNLDLSNNITLRAYDEYQGLVRADDTGYLLHIYERSGKGLLDQPGRKLILEKYDTNFDQQYSYEYGDKDMVSIELVAVANKLAWIVLEKIGNYKYRYKLIPIDFDGKEGKAQKLLDIEVNKMIDIPFTFMRYSPDSSKVAFIALFDANKKRRQTELYTAVINEDASLVWDKTTRMKGNQDQYDLLDFQLHSDDKVLCLTKYYKDEKAKEEVDNKRGEKIPGYQMNIYVVSPDSAPEKHTIDHDDSFVHDASLKVLSSGDIYCAGLTSRKHRGNLNGVFVARMDQQLNLQLNATKQLDIQDLISLDKADADVNFKKKNQGLDDQYELTDFVVLTDGSIVIAAEENYTENVTDPFNQGFRRFDSFNRNNRNSVYLNSDDIALIKVTPDGTIGNIKLLPKKQSHLVYNGFTFFNPSSEKLRESNLYLSHGIMQTKDKLYFFYNEHRSNFDENNKRRVAELTSRMATAIADVSEDFDYRLTRLFPEDAKLLLSPRRSKQINANQYFITLLPPDNQSQRSIRIGVINF